MPVAQKLPPCKHYFVRTNEVQIHVAELEGEGKPLILLHGIGMDWRVWQAISRRLHQHFRLYMLDLRGHGTSEKPQRGYTLAHYAADVEDTIDALGLTDVALLGSSLGGMATTAVEAPVDVVSHRILVDPPLTGGPVRDVGMMEDILELKHRPEEELAAYLKASNPGSGSFYLRTMSEMWHEAADGVLIDLLADQHGYFEVDAALRSNEAPTLIMQADPELGGILRPDQARHALSLLPHGYLVMVNDAGHAVHAHQPAQFTQLVADFVAGRVPAETQGVEHGA